MPVIEIVGWAEHYENNRTRELKKMAWVPMPNRHDGDGYTRLLHHPNGPAHFGAWCALVEVASRCDIRGTLLRGHGEPINADSLARMTHIPIEVWVEALPRLVTIGWITMYDIPQEGAVLPQEGAPAPHPGAMKGMEGKEGNGRKGTEEDSMSGTDTVPDPVMTLVDSQSREKEPIQYSQVVDFLNRFAHTSFRAEAEATRKLIKARWHEGFRLQDFERVIESKCAQWLRDPKMVGYLRPLTLFGTKFESYLNEAPIGTPCIECGVRGSHKYDCSKSKTAQYERESALQETPPDTFEDDIPGDPAAGEKSKEEIDEHARP